MLPRLPVWLLLGLAVPWMAPAAEPALAVSSWVSANPDGSLTYRTDERGNAIPDFSRAGYRGGEVRLPDVPVLITLEPSASRPGEPVDDGARIQEALDRVGAAPVGPGGWRGAVLLRRGRYHIAGSLHLRESGVVLRGESNDENGTVLVATGRTKRSLVVVGAEGVRRGEVPDSRRRVVDAYVPWSSREVTLDSVAGLEVGARVILHRPSTAAWIAALGMDQIKLRPGAKEGSTRQWQPGEYDLHFERTIQAIQGQRVTFDAPVMNAIEPAFGGATVYRYTFPRAEEIGVERLRLVSAYERGRETSDEDHAWIGVELRAVENAWVRDLQLRHFSHGVEAGGDSLFVTIQDCGHREPVSLITGGRRYAFTLNGQYGLVQRCQAEGSRHAFVTGSRVRGPNVFRESTAVNSHADTGPHHRWAVGTLYDNVTDDREIHVQDRQWAGSGHGWAGAQQVLWNCRSPRFVLQQPPTAQNYAIGCVGEFVRGNWAPGAPTGIIESTGRHVQPRSLYLAQLVARRGPAAGEPSQ